MAIGWLTVLQSVPWSEVVRNAPKVAAGAKKLWGSVAKKDGVDHAADLEMQFKRPPELLSLGNLQTQITTLQSVVGELHLRLSESTDLMKALAEQNTQLIQRIEATRKRTARLSVVLTLVCAATGAALWLSLR